MQECPLFVPVDEVFHMTELVQVLEVHNELNEVELAVFAETRPTHRQVFLCVIHKFAEKSQLFDNKKALVSFQHFFVAQD